MSPATRFPLGLAMVILIAACAPRGADAPLAATSYADSNCRPVAFPAEVPAAAELVDVDALSGGVAAVWDWANLESGEVLLTMAYDEEGLNIRREVIGHSITPVAADSIQKLVFASLREVPEAEEPWSVRLRVEGNDEVRFITGRSEFCPPRPRDPDMERAMRSIQFRAARMERGVRVRTVQVQTTIDPSGRVQATQVRALPVDTRMQQQILDHLRGFFFEPARLDGVPTWGSIDIPVRVRGI